jgi:hypothetical protein
MGVCAEYRIPHSVFLRDWTPQDRDKAIWWQVRKSQMCPSCGTRDSEWDEAEGGSRHAYKAVFTHCRGCEVKARSDEELESARNDFPRGTTVVLRPNLTEAGHAVG